MKALSDLQSFVEKKWEVSDALVVVSTAAAAIFLVFFAYAHFSYEMTDDAVVQSRSTLLSSKVPGLVTQVKVDDNEKVKAGQILVEIDTRDFKNSVNASQAEMDAMDARLRDAEKKYNQSKGLLKSGAVNQQQFDTAEGNYRELKNKVEAAKSHVEQNQLNLEYTVVRAPFDGVIGKRNAEVGMYASVGQPLMGFVQGHERWIIANLKETQLVHIHKGSHAYVEVDAIPGRTFEGVVESLSPNTGSTFALLPPDNATGNFLKIVQRVPVKILLQNLTEADIDLLQVGLSANVKISSHS